MPNLLNTAKIVWAVLLSLIYPGTGHIYARCWALGMGVALLGLAMQLVWQLLTWLAAPYPVELILLLILACCGVALSVGSAIDAGIRASSRQSREKPSWARSTWLAGLGIFALSTLMDECIGVGWHAYSVPNSSGAPTIRIGDVFYADNRQPGKMPQRGDIIVFHPTLHPNDVWFKRAVGLPGETIRLTGGELLIDGIIVKREAQGQVTVDELDGKQTYVIYREYLPGAKPHLIYKLAVPGDARFLPLDPNNTDDYVVPADSVFVLGDNRDNSSDSRWSNGIGFVSRKDILGRATAIIWSAGVGPRLKAME
jgi:signal peptidase I